MAMSARHCCWAAALWVSIAAGAAPPFFLGASPFFTPPASDDGERYRCGAVPREALAAAGWPELALMRCPRGQAGDQRLGERFDPTEQEFLACGLVSSTKFVVWTPHLFLHTDRQLGRLLAWARERTTCDFTVAERCPNSSYILVPADDDAPGGPLGHCLAEFDVTAQPAAGQALAQAALDLFKATGEERGVEGLSFPEAEMAFGVVLGYPKYATRAYQDDPPGFDDGYARAVSWLLRRLPPGSSVFRDVEGWPGRTNSSAWNGTASAGDGGGGSASGAGEGISAEEEVLPHRNLGQPASREI